MTNHTPRSILITNSHMPKAIGDAIAAVPALHRFLANSNIELVVWSCPQIVDLFDLGVPQASLTQIVADQEDGKMPEFAVRLDTQSVVKNHMDQRLSLVQMYAKELRSELHSDWWGNARTEECLFLKNLDRPYVLLSPFSHSDGGTATKTWAIWKWHKLASMIKEQGIDPVVIGTRENDMDQFKANGTTCLTGMPIRETAWGMKHAKATITVDNGMGWLAQALSAPHIQILSSNMPRPFAWDFGHKAVNVINCQSATINKVWDSLKTISGVEV